VRFAKTAEPWCEEEALEEERERPRGSWEECVWSWGVLGEAAEAGETEPRREWRWVEDGGGCGAAAEDEEGEGFSEWTRWESLSFANCEREEVLRAVVPAKSAARGVVVAATARDFLTDRAVPEKEEGEDLEEDGADAPVAGGAAA